MIYPNSVSHYFLLIVVFTFAIHSLVSIKNFHHTETMQIKGGV